MQVLSSDFSSTFIVRRLDNTSLTDSALVGIMRKLLQRSGKQEVKNKTQKTPTTKTDKIQY